VVHRQQVGDRIEFYGRPAPVCTADRLIDRDAGEPGAKACLATVRM
jgi:hypothetical protein